MTYGTKARKAISARGETPTYVWTACRSTSHRQLDPEGDRGMTFIRDIADKALLELARRQEYAHHHPPGKDSRTVDPRRLRKRRERRRPLPRMGQQRRVHPAPKPGAHQQRLSPALLERGDRKLRPQRPYDLTYPNVDYRSMMFQDTKPYYKANVTIDGGAETPIQRLLGYAGGATSTRWAARPISTR